MLEKILKKDSQEIKETVADISLALIGYVPNKIFESPIFTTATLFAGSVGLGLYRGYNAANGNHISPEIIDSAVKYMPAIVTSISYAAIAFFATLTYGHGVPVEDAKLAGIKGAALGAGIGGVGTILGYHAGYGIAKMQ